MRSTVTPILLALLPATLMTTSHADIRYYSLLLEGKKAGYCRIQEERVGQGLKLTSDCVIKVTMLGAPFDIRYQVVATYAKPADALPKRYTMSFDAGPRKVTTDSRFTKGNVEVDLTVNGVKEHKSLKLPSPCVLVEGNLPETWERSLRAIKPGRKENKVAIYAPSAAELGSITVHRNPDGVVSAETSGIPLNFTLDDKSGSIRLMDVPSQKARFQLADKTALTGIAGVEAASRAFAVSNISLENSSNLESLTVDIDATVAGEKISNASLQLPRQKFAGKVTKNKAVGRLTIQRVKYDGSGAASLPLNKAQKSKHAQHLVAESMTESDDPDVKALALKLSKGCKTTWEAAEKIGRWVHENIAYRITGVGARQCLKEKAGDCGPHAWLSIALLRAAGVPARITGGALYTDLLGGSFGQHYWTDVWTGDKSGWIPMDTTAGEIGTLSPTHLNLWSRAGGIASLSVKVVNYSPKRSASASDSVATPRKPMNIGLSETWEYSYVESGKNIGKETARVSAVGGNGDVIIDYKIDLKIQETDVAFSGNYVVSSDGDPVSLTMKVIQGGITQTVDMKVNGTKAKAAISAAGIATNREIELPAGSYVGMAISAFTWDLLFRSISWEVGKAVSAPVYLVDGLRLERLKFEPTRELTLKIGSREIPCIAIKAGGHEQFFVEKATGKLIRSIPGGDKMVVQRVLD